MVKSGEDKRLSRRPHKPEEVGSTPAAATNPIPDQLPQATHRRRSARSPEVLRAGFCREHKRALSQFLGAQERGWVFFCPAGMHSVVNLPAEGEPDLPAEGEPDLPAPKGNHHFDRELRVMNGGTA